MHIPTSRLLLEFTFSDLEERKHKHFLEKMARAKIKQKPYGAFLNDRQFCFFTCDVTGH